mgnify:CR=1 FL=1
MKPDIRVAGPAVELARSSDRLGAVGLATGEFFMAGDEGLQAHVAEHAAQT